MLGVGGKRQFTPSNIANLSRLATLGYIRSDPGGLGKRRPLGNNLPHRPKTSPCLLDGQMLHPVNGRGVRLGDEGGIVLGGEVFDGTGEIAVEFFEFEPDCEAFEFPFE